MHLPRLHVLLAMRLQGFHRVSVSGTAQEGLSGVAIVPRLAREQVRLLRSRARRESTLRHPSSSPSSSWHYGSQQRLKEKVTGRINDAGNCAYPSFELVVVVRQAAEDRSIGAGGVEAALRKSSASSEAAILEELP